MMKDVLVTVAMPAYKTAFLHEAIDSVLNQTYKNIELIIVNDKSPEDVEAVVRRFSDPRIRYYCNETNLGSRNPAMNWNRCLEYAEGEFFALICDDDIYSPDFIESLLTISEQYLDCNVFRARGGIVDSNGKLIEPYPSSPEWETVGDYMWHVFKGLRKQTISEFMYRTSHIRKCGGYVDLPLAWHADYLSIYRIGLSGGIASAPARRIQLSFRQSGKNISSKDSYNTYEKILATSLYCDQVRKICEENDIDCKESILKNMKYHAYEHNKWFLRKARKLSLLKILFEHKKLGVSPGLVFKSFFRH